MTPASEHRATFRAARVPEAGTVHRLVSSAKTAWLPVTLAFWPWSPAVVNYVLAKRGLIGQVGLVQGFLLAPASYWPLLLLLLAKSQRNVLVAALRHPRLLFYVAFPHAAAVVAGALLASSDPYRSLVWFAGIAIGAYAALCVSTALGQHGLMMWLRWTAAVGAVVVGLMICTGGEITGAGRLHAGFLATSLAFMMFPVAVVSLFSRWHVGIPIAGAAVYVMALTRARGGIGAAAVGAAVALGVSRRYWLLLTLLLGLALLSLVYGPDTLLAQSASALELNDPRRGFEGGATGRVVRWEAGLGLFYESPVIGHGFQQVQWTHNGWISLLAEVGLLGTAPLVYFYGRAVWAYARKPGAQLTPLALGLLAGHLFMSMFEGYVINVGGPPSLIALTLALHGFSLHRPPAAPPQEALAAHSVDVTVAQPPAVPVRAGAPHPAEGEHLVP